MAARLCLLGSSSDSLSLIFDTLKALGQTQDLIIVENLRTQDAIPYDCGLPHERIWYETYSLRDSDTFFIAATRPRVKQAIFDFFAGHFPISREKFVNLIHPSAQLAQQQHLDHGIHLGPGCIMSPFADLAFGVSVSRGASVGHHARVAEFASISPGAHIAGHSDIGRGTTIGLGAAVFDHVSVGADCLIGGGSVVNRDIPDGVVAYGNPCRVIRERSTLAP